MTKTWMQLLAVPAAVLAVGCGAANAGKTLEEAGVLVCVNDKWDEKEPEKGHKLVDYAGRCVKVPDDSAAAKSTEDCKGKYEYLPDGSWTASGTCTITHVGGPDTISIAWDETSKSPSNPYKATGGTGKFKGITGGGTYQYDQLTDALLGGRYSHTFEIP
jgi:hypothetical protein